MDIDYIPANQRGLAGTDLCLSEISSVSNLEACFSASLVHLPSQLTTSEQKRLHAGQSIISLRPSLFGDMFV